jgi:hypothetical protein
LRFAERNEFISRQLTTVEAWLYAQAKAFRVRWQRIALQTYAIVALRSRSTQQIGALVLVGGSGQYTFAAP